MDLATLGIKVDATSTDAASDKLDKLTSTGAKAEVRPTDYTSYDSAYSVGKTGTEGIVNNQGSTPLTDNKPRSSSGGSGGGLTIAPSWVVHANGADDGTVTKIKDMLNEHTDYTVNRAREAVAKDNVTAARRQNLGTVG